MNNIKKLLEKHNMSAYKLHQLLGVSKTAVSKWVNQKSDPAHDMYLKILDLLGENDFDIEKKQSDLSDALKIKLVPILSYVQAGEFTSNYKYDDADIEYIPLQASELPNNAFLMRVKGDSMVYDYSPSQRLKIDYARFSINEGECVLVDTEQNCVDSLIGKVVVAHNGTGVTVKLVYEEEQGNCLMPLNSRLQNSDNIKRPDEARVIGKVIKVINKRNFG